MDAEDKLILVRDWVDSGKAPEKFNDDFICSLEDAYEEYGELTSRQEDALDNIIKSFRIKTTRGG